MRIAMIVTGGLHPSGREQVVPLWISLFSRLTRQHEVHAFAVRHLPRPQTYSLHGFTVHDLGRPSAPGFSLWAQERALAKAMAAAGPFDLVHGFFADPAGVLATRMGRRFSIPSIVTCDSGEFVALEDIGYGSQRTARGRSRVSEAVNNATRVHVHTWFMARQLQPYQVAPAVIPLGVDVPAEVPARTEGPPWRLLQIGSLSRVKNQSLLIDAHKILGRDDIEVDFVGEDTLNGALQKRAATKLIRFHGFVPHDQLAPLRAAAHFYVQTSRHEGSGTAVLEAAASGLPVLGTDVGYVSDWRPSAARAFDCSPNQLAIEIVKLLGDGGSRRRLGQEARAFAEKFNADYSAIEVDKLYRTTLGRVPD